MDETVPDIRIDADVPPEHVAAIAGAVFAMLGADAVVTGIALTAASGNEDRAWNGRGRRSGAGRHTPKSSARAWRAGADPDARQA